MRRVEDDERSISQPLVSRNSGRKFAGKHFKLQTFNLAGESPDFGRKVQKCSRTSLLRYLTANLSHLLTLGSSSDGENNIIRCGRRSIYKLKTDRGCYEDSIDAEEMAGKQQLSTGARVSLPLLMMLWLTIWPALALALGCQSDRSGCKECIVDQMKYGCPSCVPLLHCMARCLWGGTAKTKCVRKCDCNGGKPKLSDCKKCMSRCKCSCVA